MVSRVPRDPARASRANFLGVPAPPGLTVLGDSVPCGRYLKGLRPLRLPTCSLADARSALGSAGPTTELSPKTQGGPCVFGDTTVLSPRTCAGACVFGDRSEIPPVPLTLRARGRASVASERPPEGGHAASRQPHYPKPHPAGLSQPRSRPMLRVPGTRSIQKLHVPGTSTRPTNSCQRRGVEPAWRMNVQP